MMLAAIVLFAIGACFGLAMATLHFLGKSPPPLGLAAPHGIFVLSGFSVLAAEAWPAFVGRSTWALGIFGLAAIGGSAMVLGWRYRPLPSALVVIHGGAALLGFAVLLTAYFSI